MIPIVYASRQFPGESQSFEVVTVPKVWVNEKIFIDGTAPSREMMAFALAAMIRQALDDSIPAGKLRIGE